MSLGQGVCVCLSQCMHSTTSSSPTSSLTCGWSRSRAAMSTRLSSRWVLRVQLRALTSSARKQPFCNRQVQEFFADVYAAGR